MKKSFLKRELLVILILIIWHLNVFSQKQTVRIETSKGLIVIDLYEKKAPLTVRNFLLYVDKVGEEGGSFYRTVTMENQADKKVKIEVVQGGFELGNIDTSLIKPIPLERTNFTGIKHKNGTISMARDIPDSGTTEFFICIGDQPSLDFGGARNPDGQGFAAFGKVKRGMKVVREIQNSPSKDQSLNSPIKIIRIYR